MDVTLEGCPRQAIVYGWNGPIKEAKARIVQISDKKTSIPKNGGVAQGSTSTVLHHF